MDADVYWWEPDGRITAMSPGDGLYFMSCVHPSGTHAVCWGGTTGRPRLWFGDGSGTFDAITAADHSARYPAFNAHGDVLVYCRSHHHSERMEQLRARPRSTHPHPAAPMSIVVRDADGRWEREITDGRYQDQRPALSPDGSQVVFVSNRRSPHELWLMSTTGGEPIPLLEGVRAYRPWWSVDGRHIFFFSLRTVRHRLHMMPVTGGQPEALVNDDRGHTHGPYAELDGRTLIAHSTRDAMSGRGTGRWALYEFPLDGSRARRLTPPRHPSGAHGTRARNGVVTFDVSRQSHLQARLRRFRARWW